MGGKSPLFMCYNRLMMNYGYWGPMTGGGSVGIFGFLGIITWLVWLAVVILLVAWLWKKIN
ncbi:hypothetical protein A3C77_01605 [Candidatus Giovannonibacteria bacterium RIFCSPHIGHO2_02_FULL_45_13]|nr:MAG: hypothetical protein A3C77_01605 [Candidatus Giovannonibacteria bacterium RIFCSPHIGHO2_02_FULL_45_13]